MAKMSLKEKILMRLEAEQGFVSGQQLCDEYQVSRTAVWKAMKTLQTEGYEIEAINNRGYRLVKKPDLETAPVVAKKLTTWFWGHPVYFFDEVDSTNNVIKLLAEGLSVSQTTQGMQVEGEVWAAKACEGTLAIAEYQSAGKGRRGRRWEGEKGVNVFMSFLLRPQIQPENASMLTLILAMAGRKAVEEVTGLRSQIKWPNDLVVNGKKICGMLTEMSAEMDEVHYIVAGIGINVNSKTFAPELKDKATSLSLELGRDVPRSDVIAAYGKAFEEYYEKFLQTQDMSLLIEEYNQCLVNMNRGVRVLEPQNDYSGVSLGINAQGELLVRRDDTKDVVAVRSGEVSVRGIYGYV